MESIIENPMEFSFASIDEGVRSLDLAAIRSQSLIAVQGSRIQRLVTLYRGVRPLLKAVGVLPIIPAYWRAAVQLFTATADEVLASTPAPATTEADPTFKAGKDL